MTSEHAHPRAAGQAPPGHAETAFTNRLIDSTSPYLLQHAHNPVDWYPWGNEALERARREEKPIFLSIGYAACHWCHVMEREVFEKRAIAELMNQLFVNIKVDREERPDLDDLYMLATQLMSGSGGWPMSVWLTPELQPFYAGTYFPAEDGYGRPGFPRLTQALAEAWKNRRAELLGQAKRVVEAIQMHADESAGGEAALHKVRGEEATAWARTAIEQMADRFDEVNGGLGGAPKFPPHQALQLWTGALGGAEGVLTGPEQRILAAKLVKTLDGMMNGGIYDQVGGAFARYSTDEKWLVPHFEKMLYDSAQLAPIYAAASVLLDEPDYARIARETLDFFMDEMMSDLGAFYSSLDADSDGAEGKYYVWTPGDIHAALADQEDAALIIEHFGVSDAGNWHESPVEGASVLAVAKPAEVLAESGGKGLKEMRKRLDNLRQRLRDYRSRRPRPGLDDKILTSWNGLMVSALAICGRVLKEPPYLEAAHRLIGFLLTHHMEGGKRLLRVSRGGGAAHTDAFLDDHAYLLNGLMDLIDSTMPTSLPGTMARKRALELADVLIQEFEDGEQGGFFFTSPRHETLFARMKNAADNATPSANGVAIRALLRLAQVSGKDRYREVATRAVEAFAANIRRRPEFFPTILLALMEDAQAMRQGASIATSGSTLGMPSPIVATMESRVPAGAHSASEGGAGESALMKLIVEPVPPVKGQEPFDVVLRISVAAGYHIRSDEPADREAFKTIARLRSAEGAAGDGLLASQDWAYPPAANVDGGHGYAGEVELRARCMLALGTRAGTYMLRATVLAQPWSGSACLPPERVSAEFPLAVEPVEPS